MNNKLTISLALGAGLIGGMLTRYVSPPTVSAQDQVSLPKELRAQSFVLVDRTNNIVGTFMTEPSVGPRIAGPDSRQEPGAGVPRHVVLRDSSGRLIWNTDGRVMPLSADLQ